MISMAENSPLTRRSPEKKWLVNESQRVGVNAASVARDFNIPHQNITDIKAILSGKINFLQPFNMVGPLCY